MKKSRGIYYLMLILIALATAATSLVVPWMSPIVVLVGVWWVLFFRSIHYTVTSDELLVSNGVILKKLRCIGLENIQWVMRLKLPFGKTAWLSALHTASGVVVIFADFSTKS